MPIETAGATMITAAGFGLRPRTIGELVDLTFAVYRRGFRVFAVVGVVSSLVNTFSVLAFQAVMFSVLVDSGADPFASMGVIVIYIPVLIVINLVVFAMSAVLVAYAVEDLVAGRPCTLESVARRALPRLIPAAWTAVLVSLAVMVGLLFCIFPGLIVSVLLVLAVPVVTLEGTQGIAAIGRSVELVLRRGPGGLTVETNWVRVVVVFILTMAVLYSLATLAAVPTMAPEWIGLAQGRMPQDTVFGPMTAPLTLMIPLYIVGAILQGLYTALGIIPWPLVYFDIRARHEGLDLERSVERLQGAAPAERPA